MSDESNLKAHYILTAAGVINVASFNQHSAYFLFIINIPVHKS